MRGQTKANLATVGLGYVVCLGEGTVSGAGGGQQLSGRGGQEPVEPGQQLRMLLQEIVLWQKRAWGQTGTWGPYVYKDWMLGGREGQGRPETDRHMVGEGREGQRQPAGACQGATTGAKNMSLYTADPRTTGFAPCGYRQVFNKYNTEVQVCFLSLLVFLSVFFLLLYSKNTTHTKSVTNPLFTLSVRL